MNLKVTIKMKVIKKKDSLLNYERVPYNRENAIEHHGLSCMVCDFNFEEQYGELCKGFIHVHHNKPLSETGETIIDPIIDLSGLCPNCHTMILKRKNNTLNQLKQIMKKN